MNKGIKIALWIASIGSLVMFLVKLIFELLGY